MLVSAGFDAHEDDPLGGMALTAETYGKLTQIVREVAEKHCAGRLVSVLEGGYNTGALAESVGRHIAGLR